MKRLIFGMLALIVAMAVGLAFAAGPVYTVKIYQVANGQITVELRTFQSLKDCENFRDEMYQKVRDDRIASAVIGACR